MNVEGRHLQGGLWGRGERPGIGGHDAFDGWCVDASMLANERLLVNLRGPARPDHDPPGFWGEATNKSR
jgi:hypothetical protein